MPQLRIQVKKWMQAMLTFSTDCFVGKNGKRMHILVVAPEGKLRNNRLHSAIASVKKSAAETGTGIDVHFCSSEDFVMGELFSKFPEAIGYTSARSGKTAAEIFGFKPSLLIEYSLSPLSQSEKTIFGYALKGRGGSRGL
ncbi:hypothetical protein FJZ26_06275, partial [Candidatus Parvarchaeota archaeon]|nr:hypothetical protein [Candidatus Parvarchaeota archaeon]